MPWALWFAKKRFGRLLNADFFMRRFSPAGIRDAARQESMSLQLGYPSECNAAAVEALHSLKSDPAFPVRGWNVAVHDCNAPSTI
jgi:hypothetical protein